MRKVVTRTLIASVFALSFTSTAHAVPYINYTVGATSGTFGDTAPILGSPGKFYDHFNFTTLKPWLVSITVQSTMTHPFRDNVNFISNGVKINTTVIPIISRGVHELRYIANTPISAGLQTIIVNGSAEPFGFYTGNFSFSGVPEPSTWALLLVGFGMTGFALRRRKMQLRTAV